MTSPRPDREEIERAALEHHAKGAHADAATVLIRGFGPELLGFLTVALRDPVAADDVFSIACEQILRGLPAFANRSSFRTWCYTIARHAAHHYRVSKRRRTSREWQELEGSPISQIAAQVRTATLPHLRTEVKSRFAELRDALPDEDRELLVLRVDKGLAFDEIARVTGDPTKGELAPADLKREAARLRKRFQLVKEQLTARGREVGLLGDD